jgi:uncharacterized membrane protein
LPVGIASVLVVAIVVAAIAFSGTNGGTGGAPTVFKDRDVVIPISDISKTATFYPVEIDGTTMEVLAVTAPDGTIRTAFNTCEVCYDSGRGYYKQDGDALVCQNCGNRFKTSQIEVQSSGCNPWPIFDEDKTVDSENITVSKEFLTEAKGVFANWRTDY